MKLLEIAYDLNNHATRGDYRLLFTEIRKLGKVAKGLKSSWLIQTNQTPDQIFNRLIHFVDLNDALQIIEIKDMQCSNLSKEAIDLINETLYNRPSINLINNRLIGKPPQKELPKTSLFRSIQPQQKKDILFPINNLYRKTP